MQINDFIKRSSEEFFIDPNAISKLMEILLEMPLDKMYSAPMNHIPETGDFDPYAQFILNEMELNSYKPEDLTFGDIIEKIFSISQNPINKLQYISVMRILSYWSTCFVPKNIIV